MCQGRSTGSWALGPPGRYAPFRNSKGSESRGERIPRPSLPWANLRLAFCAEHDDGSGLVRTAHGVAAAGRSESDDVNIGGRTQSVLAGSGANSRS